MLDAAIKALAQMFSRPFRRVLLKSIGLAILVLILIGAALQRLMAWLAAQGAQALEPYIGPNLQMPLHALVWVVWFGLFAGAIFVMPTVTAFVASFFSDEIAAEVEHTHYPADPPGAPISLTRGLVEGVRTGLLTVLVYLCALPLFLFAGMGFLIFFLANAYLLSREYFLLAAMRFHPVEEAKSLRKRHNARIFTAGLFIAAFVSIPILNLATPLFAMAFMTHMHKKIAGSRRELIEHT
jgi:CysZ protein